MATLTQRLERLRVQARALQHAETAPGYDPIDLWQTCMGVPPDNWQRDLLITPHRRVLMNCCRQSGKSSTAASIAITTMINEPGSLTLILSPSLRRSSELAKKVWSFYRRLNRPIPALSESALNLHLANDSRVVCLPSREETVRGFSGVTLLIVDESSRVLDELYYAIRPMLSVSQGRLIALSTPFGQRGWWYAAWQHGGDDWFRVEVPASQCPRISESFLAEERRNLGEVWYQQEYCCHFSPVAGSVFDLESILNALTPEAQAEFLAHGAH